MEGVVPPRHQADAAGRRPVVGIERRGGGLSRGRARSVGGARSIGVCRGRACSIRRRCWFDRNDGGVGHILCMNWRYGGGCFDCSPHCLSSHVYKCVGGCFGHFNRNGQAAWHHARASDRDDTRRHGPSDSHQWVRLAVPPQSRSRGHALEPWPPAERMLSCARLESEANGRRRACNIMRHVEVVGAIAVVSDPPTPLRVRDVDASAAVLLPDGRAHPCATRRKSSHRMVDAIRLRIPSPGNVNCAASIFVRHGRGGRAAIAAHVVCCLVVFCGVLRHVARPWAASNAMCWES